MLETSFARNFTFGAAQMPLNVMDAHFESFEKKVLPVLVEHGIGVLGLTGKSYGIWQSAAGVAAASSYRDRT
jgi:hypothetical protein